MTQAVSGDLQVAAYFGTQDIQGKWTAHVTFRVVLNGEIVKLYTMSYDAAHYNDFWSNFNSIRYLFDQLILKYPELAGISIPDDIENSGINH